ncbi:MAG: hypothetical protein MJZ37_08140 [Bacilli bacterium]|nr:hypothetical protein [Bacilli bacterium]
MPRVKIKAKEYKISDFSIWLDEQMYNHKMLRRDMADIIDTTPQGYIYKHRHGTWTYKDVLTYVQFFKPSDQDILKILKC